MQVLITDLLAYGKSLDEHVETEMEEVDLGKELQLALDNLKFSIQQSNARIAMPASMPRIRAQRAEIRQVFQNLISNAIKYAKPGEAPDVEIRAEERNGALVISVRTTESGSQRNIRRESSNLSSDYMDGNFPGAAGADNLQEYRGSARREDLGGVEGWCANNFLVYVAVE